MGVVSRDQGCNANSGKHKFLSSLWHRQPVWQLCLTVLQIPVSWDNSDGSCSGMCISEHSEKIRWCWGTNGSCKYVWDRVLNRLFHLDTSESESLGPNCNTRNYAENTLGHWTVCSRYKWSWIHQIGWTVISVSLGVNKEQLHWPQQGNTEEKWGVSDTLIFPLLYKVWYLPTSWYTWPINISDQYLREVEFCQNLTLV